MSQAGEGKVERVFEVQNDIGAKPCRKNKILHSDQFSPGPGSAVGENSKAKKRIGEPSEFSGIYRLGSREKGPRDLFMLFHSLFSYFSAQWSLVRVRAAYTQFL